jgi:transforming growth factor-beta-induced protein
MMTRAEWRIKLLLCCCFIGIQGVLSKFAAQPSQTDRRTRSFDPNCLNGCPTVRVEPTRRFLQLGSPQGSLQSIIQWVESTESLSALSGLFASVNTASLLGDQVATDGGMTLFAPTDEAFEKLENETSLVSRLKSKSWNLHLVNIMGYHLVNGVVMSRDLSNHATFTTVANEILSVSNRPRDVSATLINSQDEKNALVGSVEILESQGGVIYFVDNVLRPSFMSRTVAELGDEYSMLNALLVNVGLDERLQLPSESWTIFAPDNVAFEKVPEQVMAALLVPEKEADLTNILMNHIVDTVLPSTQMVDGQQLKTIGDGGTITIGIHINRIVILNNRAAIVSPDLLSINGIVHRIDDVLLPAVYIPGASGDDEVSQSINTSVLAILNQTMGVSAFQSMVSACSCSEGFADARRNYTVFAPTNRSFESVPLPIWLSPPWNLHLTELVLFHTSNSRLDTFNDEMNLTMANNESLQVKMDSNSGISLWTQQNRTVTLAGSALFGTNGAIHIIDGYLKPAFMLRTVANIPDNFSTILSLVEAAGLAELLQSPGPFSVSGETSTSSGQQLTFLAPSNAAVEDSQDLSLLNDPENVQYLMDVLLYHFVEAVIPLDSVQNTDTFVTRSGSTVTFAVRPGENGGTKFMVNDATVIFRDYLVGSGIVHGLDKVLIPDDIDSDPTNNGSPSVPAPIADSAREPETSAVARLALAFWSLFTSLAATTVLLW